MGSLCKHHGQQSNYPCKPRRKSGSVQQNLRHVYNETLYKVHMISSIKMALLAEKQCSTQGSRSDWEKSKSLWESGVAWRNRQHRGHLGCCKVHVTSPIRVGSTRDISHKSGLYWWRNSARDRVREGEQGINNSHGSRCSLALQIAWVTRLLTTPIPSRMTTLYTPGFPSTFLWAQGPVPSTDIDW